MSSRWVGIFTSVTVSFGALWVLQSSLSGYAEIVLLVFSPYWLGPIIVYMVQRQPLDIVLEKIDALDSHFTMAQRQRYRELVPKLLEAGFQEVGWSKCGDAANTAVYGILQHRDDSDVAQLFLISPSGRPQSLNGETLEFSRDRTDGSSISTSTSTLRATEPIWKGDKILRRHGRRDPIDLWQLHRTRVQHDGQAATNTPIMDVLEYQQQNERIGLNRRIQTGYWQPMTNGTHVRPTLKGAVLMVLRLLPPWGQIKDVYAWIESRRLRAEQKRKVDA